MEILIKQAHEAVYLTPHQTESPLGQMDISKFVSSVFHESEAFLKKDIPAGFGYAQPARRCAS